MHKAQLLASAQVEQIGKDSCALGAGTVLEVLANLGEKEVLVVGGIAPVRLVM